ESCTSCHPRTDRPCGSDEWPAPPKPRSETPRNQARPTTLRRTRRGRHDRPATNWSSEEPLNGLAEPSLDSDPGLPFSLRPSLSPQIGRCGDAKPRSFGCQSRILDPRPSSERGSPTSRSTPSPRTLRQCCYPCKAAVLADGRSIDSEPDFV